MTTKILLPPRRAIKREKLDEESPLARQTIYLATPVHNYFTTDYCRAGEYLFEKYSDDTVIFSHGLYDDNEHWRNCFQRILLPVTTIFILADKDGHVGRGVWSEVEFALNKGEGFSPANVLAFRPDLRVTSNWCLIQRRGGIDWKRFAFLVTASSRARLESRVATMDAGGPPTRLGGCRNG